MNVLFPVSEATPVYKIGGLGDVAAALPKALVQLGIDVRIALPLHPEINLESLDYIKAAEFTIDYNQQSLNVNVLLTTLPNSTVPLYLFQENTYLSQHTDASDNHADKFAVFSEAVSVWTAFYSPYWQPHLLHCHDWHTALIPVLLQHKYHKSYKTMLTIHNLAYQGTTTTPVAQRLAIPESACKIIRWDVQDGNMNILLEGILHADATTTVSPTYAKEIVSQEYGEKIESLLEAKKNQLYGIVNGIDSDDFNPETDPSIDHRYTVNNWQEQKRANRHQLLKELGLPIDDTKVLTSFIGRIDPYQKGIGLFIQALRDKKIPAANTQFVFLGTGDPSFEHQLHQVGDNHPQIRIITRFDEPLARKIYAASHLTLIPSRFEPCGLVQLIAMRYGTLPVARATGGLKDTISHMQNGFLFSHYTAEAFIAALNQALDTITDKTTYSAMVENAMKQDFCWVPSAKQYVMLYKELILGNNITRTI